MLNFQRKYYTSNNRIFLFNINYVAHFLHSETIVVSTPEQMSISRYFYYWLDSV